MSYKNNEDQKNYHKEYYKKNKWKLTPEQREEKAKYQHEWYLKNKKRVSKRARKFKLSKFYNMSIGDYNKMLKKQNGVCAICGKLENWKHQNGTVCQLSIDHNHKTGKVRGLLCKECNQRLGAYEKYKEVFIKYLSEFDD